VLVLRYTEYVGGGSQWLPLTGDRSPQFALRFSIMGIRERQPSDA
jgi:hypothetical protein